MEIHDPYTQSYEVCNSAAWLFHNSLEHKIT
jgi:hypothetical protein